MSGALEIWRDASVGEVREALVKDGRPISLRILRRSDEGARALWGETYCARVTKIDRRRRGAFVDLGLSREQGFLPLDAQGRARRGGKEQAALSEGAGVIVLVSREAARAKSPVVQLVETGHDGETPHRLARHESDVETLAARSADALTRARLDEAFDDALMRTAPIPGGGALTIEPCAALVAIDVDAGARAGPGDGEAFAFELNLAALAEAARQIRLRNLGGVVAIDFVSMRARAHQAKLEAAARAAFVDDPWGVQIAALSRFGVLELSRAQLRTPLHEVLRERDGRLSAETVALAALRAIEREARATSGRFIQCSVSFEVKAWLDGAEFGWRAELQNRIGLRWGIEAGAGARERIEVRAQ